MDQQQQTKAYFEKVAQDWQSKALGEGSKYNLIEARNNTVLSSIARMGSVRKFLDVGCGTGQLVLQVAGKGIEAVGIDFAKDMIAQCESNREAAGVQAAFLNASFFDLPPQADKFDVISALGFIEYISPEQLEEFLGRCCTLLGPGGTLLVGSRNRLFNAVSLNEFTGVEMALGVLNDLVAEAITLHLSASQARAFEALRKHERIYPQPASHPTTGICVDSRYQYSPAELIKRVREHRFSPQTLFPVHFHGLPTAMKPDYPDFHSELAALVERVAPLNQRLIPYCSTYVLEATRD